MTNQEIDDRRRYISEVRKSFEYVGTEQNRSVPKMGQEDAFGEESAVSFWGKGRFLAAIILFTLFLYANLTGARFFSYSAKDVVTLVEENDLYTKVKDYVMIEMQD